MAATGKWYESVCAVCPYYKGESTFKLICEGLYPRSNLHMTFPSGAEKERHRDIYCYGYEYENCPVALMLMSHSQREEAESYESEDGG